MSFEHYFSEKPDSDIKLNRFKVFLRNHTYQFITSSGVFSSKKIDKGTSFLIENMKIPNNGLILDLGTGYGPIGIVIADLCPICKVHMIDINERAVWLAKENIILNNISNASVFKSDLFDRIQENRYDLIVSNLPYTTGIKNIEKINELVLNHLTETGQYQIVVPKQQARIISHLESIFKNVEVFGKKGYKLVSCS